MKTVLLVGLVLMFMVVAAHPAMAISQRALDYRKTNDLSEYAVPKAFLAGFFIANETDPHYVFGPVGDVVGALSCPTAWLIENGERQRIADLAKRDVPLEYTVYLEADSPESTVYYVFIVQHNLDPEQWLKWRWQFHKNKAESEFGQARDRLRKALDDGVRLSGELRFIEVDGMLDMRNPEDAIVQDLKLHSVYDLGKGQKIAR